VSTAQAQEGTRTIITPATNGPSCGRWTNTPKGSPEREVFRKWVFGFLSGVNWANEDSKADFLRGTDAEGLIAWVDNYCRRNPLHDIVRTMQELVMELERQAGR
jgi:hypothetical protein